MRCEDALDLLPALARGELRADEAAALRAHLATCDECAEAWAIVDALAAARPAVPAQLAGRVSAELARRRRVARPRADRWSRVAGAGLSMAALMALVLVWPDDARESAPRDLALAPAPAPAVTDPFLDREIFGATTPTEAELDGMIRVAAQAGDEALPFDAAPAPIDEDVPALALDIGSELGDWPGADGMSAGVMLVEDLSYDEMEYLLEEMRT